MNSFPYISRSERSDDLRIGDTFILPGTRDEFPNKKERWTVYIKVQESITADHTRRHFNAIVIGSTSGYRNGQTEDFGPDHPIEEC